MSSNALLWPSQGTKPEERLDKYKYLRLPSQGVSSQVVVPPVVDIMAYEGGNIMAYEPDDWFEWNFLKRVQLTINPGQVPSTQTNFTLLIKNTYPELIGLSIDEIKFATSDNIKLPYYFQEFNTVTGELIARILKPTVDVGDVINIYYDNPTAVDEQNAAAVWAGMDFVYPLDDANNVTNLVGVNSTGTGVSQVDGKIFKAVKFANNAEFIQFTSTDWTSQSNNSSLSIAFWYKTTDADRGVFFGNFTDGSNAEFNLELNNGAIRVFITSIPDNFQTNMATPVDAKYTDGEWHLFVFTYDGTTRIPRLYFDGALELEASIRPDNSDIFFDPAVTFFAARDSRTTVNYVGDLELLRKINDKELDADAILTMYNNENDNDAFYTVGASEDRPLASTLDIMGYEA